VRLPTGRTRLAGIALIVAAVVVALVLLLGGDDGGDDAGGGPELSTLEAGGPSESAPAATPFKLSFPPNWSEVPDEQLAQVPGERLAVLRRDGRTGLIAVTRQASSPELDLEALGSRLGKQIKKGLTDAREVASRPTRLPAGEAYVYSFVRRKAGTVHTVVVVPAGAETYVLNAVIPSGDDKAAQESGEIIRSLSFD
jgi:hypothetical protein